MAENPKSCVICGGTESEGEILFAAPCDRHFVCHDDVSSFFERATKDESLFPPQCCGQMFTLEEYEDYVPFDIAWAYQVKEHGEYAVRPKFRVYCARPVCAKFLAPSAHIKDKDADITYAVCEDDACGELTCVGCKTLLEHGVQSHVCKKDEDEEKFKQTAIEKGYQACSICGATVELIEACNHITCGCGHDFCYICGKDWIGIHGCPHYGPATYDEEDYNQDGYHRNTGLNREGLTRRQENARRRDEDPDDDEEDRDEEDEAEDEEDDDPDWEVLQHLTPDQRVVVNTLHGNARDDALDQLRITLFETQGITFGHPPPPPAPHPDTEEDEDRDEEDEGENEDQDQDQDRDLIEGRDEEGGDEDPHDEAGEQEGLAQEDTSSDLADTEGDIPDHHPAPAPAPIPSYVVFPEGEDYEDDDLDSDDPISEYENTDDDLDTYNTRMGRMLRLNTRFAANQSEDHAAAKQQPEQQVDTQPQSQQQNYTHPLFPVHPPPPPHTTTFDHSPSLGLSAFPGISTSQPTPQPPNGVIGSQHEDMMEGLESTSVHAAAVASEDKEGYVGIKSERTMVRNSASTSSFLTPNVADQGLRRGEDAGVERRHMLSPPGGWPEWDDAEL